MLLGVLLGLMTLIAGCVIWICFPSTHSQRGMRLVLSVLLGLIAVCAYVHWGSWSLLQKHEQMHAVVKQLHQWLLQRPNDAQGWYYLGRLEMSQGHAFLARTAYQRAVLIQPEIKLYQKAYSESVMICAMMARGHE